MRLRNALCILAVALQAGCGGSGDGGGSAGVIPASGTAPTANAVVQRTSAWQAPVALADPGPVVPYGTSLAVDGSGTAWFFVSSLDSNLVHSARVYRRAPGQGWSAGEALGAPVDVGGFELPYPLRYYENPQIAVDDAGNVLAMVTYRDHTDASSANWASQVVVRWRDAASGSWSSPVALASVGGSYAREGRLVLERSGTGWAVWSERAAGTSSYSVFASRFSGGAWSAAERIAGNLGGSVAARVTTNRQGNPRVIVNAGGTLSYFTRSAGGGWSSPIELTRSASDPDLVVDAEDNAIATWRENGVIVARRYTPALGWENPESLSLAEYGAAHDPHLAMDASGNAIAVWQQAYALGTSFVILASRYDKARRGWVSRTVINNTTRSGDDANSPRIGFDGSGDAVAVWSKYDGRLNRMVIAANGYAAGVGWGTEEMVSAGTENALLPDVAVSVSGEAMATWWQEDRQGFIRPWSAARPASD